MVTVAERLAVAGLTPAERKVARVLLADYPVRGLEPVAKLAAEAGVSAPTVIRLVTKLDFGSYADFQQSLKSEVSARLSSPLSLYTEPMYSGDGSESDAVSRSEQVLCGGISSSFARLPRAEFDQAVKLLADPRRGVTLIGGRFSSMLAEYLAAHLRILRSNVRVVTAFDRVSAMLDVGRGDVLVAFDYRRYQHDTVRLSLIAKQQGATLIAFTDPYLSPLAAHADVILTTSVASPSPFDALTPAVALVETVIAALVDRLGAAPLERMARYDALFAGTVTGEDRS
jgi:DNA-binding MurR/RpiR family transcriptional regulator